MLCTVISKNLAKKLYFGNLPYSVTDDELREMAAKFGNVESATVITDKFSGRSKGFGFVEFSNDEDADKAVEALNGSEMNKRKLVVNEARPMEKRERGGGGFGRSRGGFGRRDFQDGGY